MEKIIDNVKLDFVALKFSTILWVVVIGIFILSVIFQINKYFTNTTQMLYWVILIGSLFTFLAIFMFWKTKSLIVIEFNEEMLTVKNQTGNYSHTYYSHNIKNYNLYNLPIKKMGTIFRLHDEKSSIYWLVWENNSFYEKIEILKSKLQKKMLLRKTVIKDYLIKSLFALPIILLITGILILLGGFVYIIYYL